MAFRSSQPSQPVSSQPSARQCQLPPNRVPSHFQLSLSQQLFGARNMPSAAVVVLIVVAAGCAFNPCLATPVGAAAPPPPKHPRHTFLTLVRAASVFQPPPQPPLSSLSHSHHTKGGGLSSSPHYLSAQSYNNNLLGLGRPLTADFSPLLQRHVGMGEPDAGGGTSSSGGELLLRQEEIPLQQNSLLATNKDLSDTEGENSIDSSSSNLLGGGYDPRVAWSKRGGPLASAVAAEELNSSEGGQGEEAMVDGLHQVGASLASNFLRHGRSGARNYDIPQIECPPAEDQMERFPCPSPDRMGRYRCIDDHVLCDGFIDCPNGEDEEMQQCMFYKTTKAHLDVIADAIIRFIRGKK